MVVEFARAGQLTQEDVQRRMLHTTAEQLALLHNDPAFHAWQAQKARRENRARVATNLLAVVACVALAVTMALLKPAATAQAPLAAEPAVPTASSNALPATTAIDSTAEAAVWVEGAVTPSALDLLPPATASPVAAGSMLAEVQGVLEMTQARLETAQAEADAAQQAATDMALRLRAAEAEREAAAARLAQLEAAVVAQEVEARETEVATGELLAHMTAQLEGMRKEVAEAEAAAAAAASLAEATAAAAAALLEAPVQQPSPPPRVEAPASACTSQLFGPYDELTLAQLEAAQMLPHQLPTTLSNTTILLPPMPRTAATSFAPQPLALYTVAAATVAAVVLAASLMHLRSRRQLATEAARAAALAARLKEAAFAKDTVDQSLGMLERELQRRMKQLEEAQQAVMDASSPRIGTAPSPPVPGALGLLTPGRGELPPPPASLVEKFLRDHNFLAVQQEQMNEWLEMEQQFAELQGALNEMQAALAEKDAQIDAYQKDLSSANEHTSLELELRSREDQLIQVRAWLDEAQEEMLETQAALQEREAECRRVSSQLEAMQALVMGGQGSQEGALLKQNLELVAQLESVTAAYEAMREQLAAASAGEARALGPAFDAVRPASATSVPGTPADLSREVQSCLEMMRATRAQLADRLAHSQGVCQAMIADCQGQAGCTSAGGEASAVGATAESNASAASGISGQDQADAAESPAPFGSPAAGEPSPDTVETNPLFEVEGWEGDELLAGTSGTAAPFGEAGQPAVLGASSRHNASATPSPRAGKSSPAVAAECTPNSFSMRAAWQAAQARVEEARAKSNCWDLAGFVRELGFQIDREEGEEGDGSSAPMDRAAFEALRGRVEAALATAAADAATSPERALAGQAMQVVREWEFPAQRINTPPPSPFWRLFGMQA